MVVQYEGITAVEAKWLVKGGVMTKRMYDYYTVETGEMRVVRRGCRNTPALVEYDSIPPEFRKKVDAKVAEDPKKTTGIKLAAYMKRDTEALAFFRSYRKPDGTSLVCKKIEEYAANAAALNAIHELLNGKLSRRGAAGKSKVNIWQKFADAIKQLPTWQWTCDLPKSGVSLRRKYNRYIKEGPEVLVHGGGGNSNSEKINQEAKTWLVVRWADQVNKVADIYQLWQEYNHRAATLGWKPLKDDRAIRNYLYRENVKPLWYGHRYGYLKAKEKYTLHHSTRLPTMRDALWYGDGTKLNLYYQDAQGKRKTTTVYEVMDVFSEVFLGYCVSPMEDYRQQYAAFKMAAQISGHRPYQIGVDNQGGHKKLQTGQFLGKLGKLPMNTQPYNGKSKTIENAFYRFQNQVMKKLWFFTGQNITAHKDESRANMEMILDNSKELPTLDEAIKAYAACRKEWNEAPFRRRGEGSEVSRMERYLSSINHEAPSLDEWDMVDIFWVMRAKPVTYTATGLVLTEKNRKYEYVVYDAERNVDLDFHVRSIDKKYFVKMDPEDMSLVHLYEETATGMSHVAAAEPKVVTSRGRQEITEWEDAYHRKMVEANKRLVLRMRDQTEDMLAQYDARAEDYGLNGPRIHGVEAGKAGKKVKTNKKTETMGELHKTVATMEDDPDLWDRM